MKWILTIIFCALLFSCGKTETVTNTVVQLRYTTLFILYSSHHPINPNNYNGINNPYNTLLTDSTGTIHLYKIEPVVNFRTNTHVNFSTKFIFGNHSSSQINYKWDVNGYASDNSLVFNWHLNSSIDPLQLLTITTSYGEPLTLSQYDSIVKWTVTNLERYN